MAQKIIREAAEQAEWGIVPMFGLPMKLDEAVKDAGRNDVNIFFDITGQPLDVSKFSEPGRKVGIFIGPEGGWDEEEIKLAQEKNFQIASLGKLTLRAETAAIVASYLVASAKN